MNRISIIHKLLNRNTDFMQTLQELYLITLSSKGPKSLDTTKNLNNYLISLITFERKTACNVLDFVK
jgi:hypothetical protein